MTVQISKTEISRIVGNIKQNQLKDIKHLVLFVGHAHSGHSIIGALLDSHPDICITNEVNVAKLIKDFKLSKQELESLLIYLSKNNESNKGWHNTEYKYKTANSFQGQTSHPLVIGDKKGGATTRIIMNNPKVLNTLLKLYNNKIKFINVHRNPIDIVAAYAHYWKQTIGSQHVTRYIENTEANLKIKSQIDDKYWMDIDQSEFVTQPQKVISKLFDYLDVAYTKQQVTTWTQIVKPDLQSKTQQMQIPESIYDELNQYIKKGNT